VLEVGLGRPFASRWAIVHSSSCAVAVTTAVQCTHTSSRRSHPADILFVRIEHAARGLERGGRLAGHDDSSITVLASTARVRRTMSPAPSTRRRRGRRHGSGFPAACVLITEARSARRPGARLRPLGTPPGRSPEGAHGHDGQDDAGLDAIATAILTRLAATRISTSGLRIG